MAGPWAPRVRHRVAGAVIVLLAAWWGCLAAVSGLTAAERSRPGTVPWPCGAYLSVVGAAAALAWRVRRPPASAATVLGLTYAYRALGYPGEAPGIALFATCFAVGAHAGGRRWRARTVAVTLLAAAVPVLPPHPAALHGLDVWATLGPGLGMVTAAALGVTTRYRRVEAEERVRHAAERVEHEIARRVA